MPSEPIVPPKDVEQLRRKGLRDQEIVDWIEQKTGRRVSESYVTTVAQRYGFAGEPRNIYAETLPWVVRRPHAQDQRARCLRWLGRRRAGMELSKDPEQRLNSLLRRLAKEDALITYFGDTDDGWFYVDREQALVEGGRQPDPGIPIVVFPGQELRVTSSQA